MDDIILKKYGEMIFYLVVYILDIGKYLLFKHLMLHNPQSCFFFFFSLINPWLASEKVSCANYNHCTPMNSTNYFRLIFLLFSWHSTSMTSQSKMHLSSKMISLLCGMRKQDLFLRPKEIIALNILVIQ